MVISEMVYQAGGAHAVRAMQDAGVVIQQYYDKSYTADGYLGLSELSATKTLGNALNSVGPDALYQYGLVSNTAQSVASSLSTVTVLGQSVRFTGKNVANVDERMPFGYETAKAFLSQATQPDLMNGLTAQKRIYQDQTQTIQRIWGTPATVFNPLRR